MVPDGQKVWTDRRNGRTNRRTDNAKTISLRLRRGIIIKSAGAFCIPGCEKLVFLTASPTSYVLKVDFVAV